jgi:energy-converting hydrogenase A subunit M
MKHIRRIFESIEDDKRYIQDCFLDISENPDFEVDDLVEIEIEESRGVFIKKNSDIHCYKIHIESGQDLYLPPVGKVYTSLAFLRMKNEKLSELYEDIDIAIKRIKDRFDYKCDVRIQVNRREEIDITILVAK